MYIVLSNCWGIRQAVRRAELRKAGSDTVCFVSRPSYAQPLEVKHFTHIDGDRKHKLLLLSLVSPGALSEAILSRPVILGLE